MSTTKSCPQCHAEVASKNHFCLQCGFMFSSLDGSLSANLSPTPSSPSVVEVPPSEPTPVAPNIEVPSSASPSQKDVLASSEVAPSPLVDLLLIRSPELPTVRFAVHNQSQIGRLQGNLVFKEDPYISPLHATLFYKDNQLMIRDEMSLNGVFIRLNSSVEIEIDEVFVAGEQLFMVERDLSSTPTLTNIEKDTRFFANSQKATDPMKRLIHLLEGGQRGICVPFIENSLSIGRQGCDLNFAQDRFMSSRHCHVSLDNERVILTDMGSRNGTFIQVKGESTLSIGDFLLIGKQLLQVQPHQSDAQSQISI